MSRLIRISPGDDFGQNFYFWRFLRSDPLLLDLKIHGSGNFERTTRNDHWGLLIGEDSKILFEFRPNAFFMISEFYLCQVERPWMKAKEIT